MIKCGTWLPYWKHLQFSRIALLPHKWLSGLPGNYLKMLRNKTFASLKFASPRIGRFMDIISIGTNASMDFYVPRSAPNKNLIWRLGILPLPPAAWDQNLV